MTTLTAIAEQLLAHAKQIDAYNASEGLAPPSYRQDTLSNLPDSLRGARDGIINGCATLRGLTEGPEASITNILYSWTDLLAIQAINHHKIAQAVPLHGSASYAEIAAATGQPERLVFRYIRQAMINHIFEESSPGQVCHTEISRIFATKPGFADYVYCHLDHFAPTAQRYIEAQEKSKFSEEPNETAFAVFHGNTNAPSAYALLGSMPQTAMRFASGLGYMAAGEAWHTKHLLAGFDWASADKPGAVVVDLGGGEGYVSQFLARNTQHLKFVVQDLPHVIAHGQETLSVELAGRVEFALHDFMAPQPVGQHVDVFILRWILHNWSDKYALQILKNLVPAMKAGSRVLICEYVLESEAVTEPTHKLGYNMDMAMAAIFNGRERSVIDFEELFKQADGRFVLKAAKRPVPGCMSVVEVAWGP